MAGKIADKWQNFAVMVDMDMGDIGCLLVLATNVLVRASTVTSGGDEPRGREQERNETQRDSEPKD